MLFWAYWASLWKLYWKEYVLYTAYLSYALPFRLGVPLVGGAQVKRGVLLKNVGECLLFTALLILALLLGSAVAGA